MYNKYILSELNDEFKLGDIVKGTVKNIQPYGVFVETENGVTGLLHIEDISVSRIKTPYERFDLGQNINVMIKKIDTKTNRVEFTYKELLGTWEENVQEYKEGNIVKGIVREADKNKKGIFIELKPNLVGMAEYQENVNYGDEIDVYVKKIIKDKKKIKLIIK